MPASLVASVVYLRIQDFARRSASEQARLRAQLQAALAVAAGDLLPASRVVLDAGDGAAIVVLDDPRGALRAAERTLAANAVGLPLSAGLNHGALQLAGRKNGEGMTGDGIAVAAAVAGHAAPGLLLASRSFRDALAEAAPGQEHALGPSGTFTDPGLRSHELYTLNARALARRSRRYTVAAAVMVVGLIGGGIALRASNGDAAPLMEAVFELVHKIGY